MIVSIFNDVIGPVMRGPSSSHCAAALRIGRLARDLMNANISHVLVEFDLKGSLPTTHRSQGSDMGLFGGLLGWEADDERLPNSDLALKTAGIDITFKYVDYGDVHPNTYRLTLSNSNETHSLHAISTGGGIIEVIAIDGLPVSLFGDKFIVVGKLGDQIVERKLADPIHSENFEWTRKLCPVMPIETPEDFKVPFQTARELLMFDDGRDIPLFQHGIWYEMARGEITETQAIDKMLNIVSILKRSIQTGLAGTEYEDRVLGCQSVGFQQKMAEGGLLNGGALNRMVLYVTALMEVKSSMGVIVAMPTAGACAALPGAVIAMAEEMGLDDYAIARAFFAAGTVGVFIATAWSFAAEVGGCQAEGGSASAMAAAALVALVGGSLHESLTAASMALQSMIGLICDPIANRVEAPCLGKNVMAASNALCCANMALAGFDPVVPLDEVIETARRVSGIMPRELRCTGLGGLSITPTSKLIEELLLSRQKKVNA